VPVQHFGTRAGPIAEVDPDQARAALLALAYGGFLDCRAAAKRMLPHGAGNILMTGVSTSMKGCPQSAVFARPRLATD